MPYVAINPKRFVDESVGSGQCVAYVQAVTQVGHTSTWRRGVLVKGATLAVGTAIATFNEKGRYINDTTGRSHAAIYLGQDAIGIQVLDQWLNSAPGPNGKRITVPMPVHERTIRFRKGSKEVNDGCNYYVIA